ncbi:MAG: helix-turn-helix domain-containing protein [Proteobacteria bacterium]|nr:helix-turn-helix domain-containing protein [Pseudomonadota bacterium]
MQKTIAHRSKLHAALGEPVRLAIVEELAVSDRSPKELGKKFELTTNLLTHHLDILAHVGLVRRVASSGDRRRKYIQLDRAAFADLGIAASPNAAGALFICSHNSARSQLAAALWQMRTGQAAMSAGTHPARRVHPGAVSAAARLGIDLSAAIPALFDPSQLPAIVITVCDQVHEEIETDSSWWHWSIPDPVATGSKRAFDRVVAELEDRIGRVLGSHQIDPRSTTSAERTTGITRG